MDVKMKQKVQVCGSGLVIEMSTKHSKLCGGDWRRNGYLAAEVP